MQSLEDCSVFDTLALEEAKVDFGQSLATCLEVPQKRQSLLSRRRCLSWGVSFPSFPSFKERLGVVGFFCSEVEPLPWVEPELLFFCLECKEPLLDLLSDLEESDFCLVLFPEVPEAQVSQDTSLRCSQYRASIAWTSFSGERWPAAQCTCGLFWTQTILSDGWEGGEENQGCQRRR